MATTKRTSWKPAESAALRPAAFGWFFFHCGGSSVKNQADSSWPGDSRRQKPILRFNESVIHALLTHQLVMVALLDDFAVIEHDDIVGMADRRQPMRDNERR